MSTRKFNKPLGEEMRNAFSRANGELLDVADGVTNLADLLAEGGLIGATGDEMYASLATTLRNKINLLAEKMVEMQNDVQSAREQYEEAESRARERFIN